MELCTPLENREGGGNIAWVGIFTGCMVGLLGTGEGFLGTSVKIAIMSHPEIFA